MTRAGAHRTAARDANEPRRIALFVPELPLSTNRVPGKVREKIRATSSKRWAWLLLAKLRTWEREHAVHLPRYHGPPRKRGGRLYVPTWQPLADRCRLTITRHSPRPLDRSNLYASVKAPEDALVRLGLLVDDSDAHCDLHVRWEKARRAEQGLRIELEGADSRGR